MAVAEVLLHLLQELDNHAAHVGLRQGTLLLDFLRDLLDVHYLVCRSSGVPQTVLLTTLAGVLIQLVTY